MIRTQIRSMIGRLWIVPAFLGLVLFTSMVGAETSNPSTANPSSQTPKRHRKRHHRKSTAPQTAAPHSESALPSANSTSHPASSVQAEPSNAAPVSMTPRAASPTSAPSTISDTRPTGTQTSARLESIRKQVEIQSAGTDSWTKAGEKTNLKTADRLRTGRGSVARIKLQDGTKVLILQNSQAEIENLSSTERTIKLLKGRVRAIVARLKGADHFAIKTPIGVASVRGTEFEVGFDEDSKNMDVKVRDGEVGVSRLGDLANEVILDPGDGITFGAEGDIGLPTQTGMLPPEQAIQTEAFDSKVKDSFVAQAAEELRNSDYQTGKSLIDVNGKRVRVEEYIVRPTAKQFKLVALNERDNRFDYMTYLGTFKQDLPEDLSVALKQVNGTLNVAPDYFLTDYQLTLSNTKDGIHDSASGGHLVQIGFDGTNFTLTDPDDISNTRTIQAAQQQADGSYKIYNPLKDSFSLVSAADKDQALQMSVLDNGNYRALTSGDTLWKTRFNSGSYDINSVVKSAYGQKTIANVLAVDLDATFTAAPITSVSEYPEGSNSLHNRLTLYYQDGSKTTYDNYILDNEGNVAPRDAFSGLVTSAAYQNELQNWNYEQKVKSSEMSDEIDLVIDPAIGTMSGLIK